MKEKDQSGPLLLTYDVRTLLSYYALNNMVFTLNIVFTLTVGTP